MTSKIVVNNIEADAGINTVTISGDVTATNITGAHHGSAANLTSIPAAQLTGTVADARISALTASKLSGALPAISAANLTSIPAANITGTLPAISGANLTNLPASGKATNLVINGAMMVAQRGTSSTSTALATVDRIYTATNGVDEAPTFSQVDVASGTTPYTLGFRKAFRVTNGNQTSGAGTSDRIEIMMRLEAQDIANSGWNYTSTSSFITFSFWIKSSVAQNFYGRIQTQDGTQQRYAIETGSLTADTWTKITKTIPGNSNLQFDNNNAEGLRISLYGFLGTDYTDSSSLNTWAASATGNRTQDNTSTWYTTNDATLEFTGLQLEVGDTATDFAHERYQDTLLKCYRYFYAHKGPLWGEVSAGDHLDIALYFPVPMRTSPSFTQVDTSLAYKNRLNQGNNTSGNIYSVSGGTNEYGAMWIARPASGSWDTQDGRHHYWHPPTGNTSYSWSAEL